MSVKFWPYLEIDRNILRARVTGMENLRILMLNGLEVAMTIGWRVLIKRFLKPWFSSFKITGQGGGDPVNFLKHLHFHLYIHALYVPMINFTHLTNWMNSK